MQRIVRVASPLVVGLAFLLPSPAHTASFEEQIALGRASLSRARNLGDPAALELARQSFLAATTGDPSRPLGHYYVALAAWELALAVRATGSVDRVVELAREGVRHCELLLDAQPRNSEAIALRGALRCLWATVPGADDALRLSGEEDFRSSQSLGPRNPRVWLVSGATRYGCAATPQGGRDAALREISRSLELFERVPQSLEELSGGTPGAPRQGSPRIWPGPPLSPSSQPSATPSRAVSLEPDWGHAEAWLWAGRVHLDAERYGAARRCFQKVLELNPANEIVRSTYLPRVEGALPSAGPGGDGSGPATGGATTTPFGAPFRKPSSH